MLIKAFVLGCENGVFHHFRDLLDANHRAAFFTKFADEKAVCGIYTQRDFGAVVGQDFE